MGGEIVIAENRSILHHAKLFRETLLSFPSSFQTVSQTFGLWRLDIFTEDAKLKYDMEPLSHSPPPSTLRGEHDAVSM